MKQSTGRKQPSFARRRATAIGVAAILLAVVLVVSGVARPLLRTLGRGGGSFAGSISSVAGGATRPLSDGWGWARDSWKARSVNAGLERELAQARVRLARSQLLAGENLELTALHDFNAGPSFPSGYRPVVARVVVRSPSRWYDSWWLDRGRRDGLRVNQPVVAGGGLAGHIVKLEPHKAEVSLITNGGGGVGARVGRTSVLGVVAAGRPGGELQLKYLTGHRGLVLGATVTTSGSLSTPERVESLYPAGIPIGEVASVQSHAADPVGSRVTPLADLRSVTLAEVLILER